MIDEIITVVPSRASHECGSDRPHLCGTPYERDTVANSPFRRTRRNAFFRGMWKIKGLQREKVRATAEG